MTLDQIALKHGTDKASNGHNYTPIYERYFEPLRHLPLCVIEAGYGGYHYPDRGGEGARMWEEYFPNAKIVSIDIHPKTGAYSHRREFHQGSQTDEDLLRNIIFQNLDAPVRIFIDDASHHNGMTIQTFKNVWKWLKSGDYYVGEDLHTSYWLEEYEGNPIPNEPGTSMHYFASLTPQLCEDTLLPEHRIELISGYLDFIHFYRNLVIIKKK